MQFSVDTFVPVADGVFYAGMLVTLLALLLLSGGRETGIAHLISPKQRHDLGKMIFAFSVFWMYLFFSQYLVIWYGNLPEETVWYRVRLEVEDSIVTGWVRADLVVEAGDGCPDFQP